MRILELGKFYPPHRGGMESLLRAWAESFVRQNGTVDCVVANDAPRTVHEELGGVRVHRLAAYGAAWSVSLCPGYLWSARRRRADVWHAHFPNPLADLACWLGGRSTPLVVHYHSDVVRQAGALGLYAPLLRWLLGRADRIVVATPRHIECSPWLGAYRDKCEVIPFGVPLEKFAPTPAVQARAAELRRRAGGRPVVLTVGRLVAYKGQRYLLEAARGLEAEVWLAGDGPLRASLESLSGALGLAGRVRFWGEVDEPELVAMLHACDLFVLPSISSNEAFGLVQVEAMACGKPVVCCALKSGVPFVTRDEVSGLVVPPADSAALAGALRRLLEDPGLATRFGAEGRRRAREEFDETKMNARYWAAISAVAACHPPAPRADRNSLASAGSAHP